MNTAEPSSGAIEDICTNQMSRTSTLTPKKLTTSSLVGVEKVGISVLFSFIFNLFTSLQVLAC